MKPLLNIPYQSWILSFAILIIPMLTETIFEDSVRTVLTENEAEMIWLITLLPSVFFSYYKGLHGGVFIAVVSITTNILFEITEAFQQNGLQRHDISVTILGVVLQITIVISIGLLADKLKHKELILEQLNSALEKLSIVDELTGLANRRGLLTLSEQIVTDKCQHICLFIDLDGFKCINDRYGHGIGDEVLKITAKRLQDCLREADIVGRIGGDEFVCLIKNSNKNNVKHIAKRIITSLSTPELISGHQLVVTPSIGIAISPFDGNNMKELLKNADSAMYEAKKLGKNNFFFYEKGA
ncbi:GGDEF domain-containing protein [Niallia sp. NCCP-28]|uniref:GGDEF domain-containing protein n=1 Tax=Niallia sp. NCCP-28 TaxID=2934712 RepID=UPI00208CF9F2|nr:GGDEF domain-containing protein [Niallia sp. NCCP-28]GKU82948.1 hypothetical protein NCCP28_23440 [Niallia sp. NCCP-28]